MRVQFVTIGQNLKLREKKTSKGNYMTRALARVIMEKM